MVPPHHHIPSHSELCEHVKAIGGVIHTRLQPSPLPRTAQALGRAIGKEQWEEAGAIIDRCGEKDPSGTLLHQVCAQPVPERFLPAHLKGLPPLLAMVAQGAPDELIKKLSSLGIPVDQRTPDTWYPRGATAMHVAIYQKQPALIPTLFECGLSPHSFAGDGTTTPLGCSLELETQPGESIVGLRELLLCGISLHAMPSAPELTGVNLRGCTIAEDLKGLSLRGAILIDADLHKAQLDGADLRGSWYSPATKLPPGVSPAALGMKLAQTLPDIKTGEMRFYSEPELHTIYDQKRAGRPNYLAKEADLLVQHSKSVRDGCLYLLAAEESARFSNLGTGAAMTELLPRLLYAHPPASIPKLLGAIEATMDNLKPPAGFHQNEPEFMALLRHPEDRNLERAAHYSSLTTLITSIPNWLSSYDKLVMNRETAMNWGRIGSLNFSFLRWKFDSMRGYETLPNGYRLPVAQSLIERYGGTPVETRPSDFRTAPDGSKKLYLGRGFAFPPGSKEFDYIATDSEGNPRIASFDPRFSIELRQADYKISHPEYGTLLIPAMSRLFGRNYKHPAYYSERAIGAGLTQKELLGLTPENLSKYRFRDIIDIDLNASEGLQARIGALLDGFEAFCQDYNRWKFDTHPATAFSLIPSFKGEGMRMMAGGYASPGFVHVVNLVERLDREAQSRAGGSKDYDAPALVFVPRDTPPLAPYTYVDDEGMTQQRLVITPDRLAALKELAGGTLNEKQLRKTGLFPFLQMGFHTQGELMIVSGSSHANR